MEFNLKKPCKECPYLAQMKGWIGSHISAQEFHDLVQADIRFSCHMTHEAEEQNQCAGYALYMNAICKLSKDPKMLELQNTVKMPEGIELLSSFTGEKLVKFHGK